MNYIKYYIFILFLILSAGKSSAQQQERYVFPVADKFLYIILRNASVDIEGYKGKEIIVESTAKIPGAAPEEAAGMKQQSIAGKYPASAAVKPQVTRGPVDGALELRLTGNDRHFKVKIPGDLHTRVRSAGSIPGIRVSLKELSGELELSGSLEILELSRISGPISISGSGGTGESGASLLEGKGITGSVRLSQLLLKSLPSSPAGQKIKAAFIISVNGADVDISLPSELQASIEINSRYGEIYSDIETLSASVVRTTPIGTFQTNSSSRSGTTPVSAGTIFKGTMNGGGVPITINTIYGNIYLRKEK